MLCAVTADPDVKVDQRQLAFWVEALDQQSREFAADWKIPYVPCALFSWDVLLKLTDDEVAKFVRGTRLMTIQNDVSVPGAVGFHDALLGVIFARVQFGGASTPVTMSHEKCEMDGDPLCDSWSPWSGKTQQAKEACDRVEDDVYIETATIGSDSMPVSLSNYLLPSAFVPGSSGPWDRMQRLTTWDGMTKGGYVIVRDEHGNVDDVFAKGDDQARRTFAHKKARPDSRVARRLGVAP